MRLGIKAKQVLGVATIVGLTVVAVSMLYLASLARISLQETRDLGMVFVDAILSRALEVVTGEGDPRAALQGDAGVRDILRWSLQAKGVLYAAVVDANGIVIAGSEQTQVGRPLRPVGNFDDLMDENGFAQFLDVHSQEGQLQEVHRDLLLNGQKFGSIRVGVSTLLIRKELDGELTPTLTAAGAALLVAILVAMFFAQLILRPIHVIRGGLTRLGRGELGVKLELSQQDEFGELGNSFNAVSDQLSADRSELTGQVAKLESAVGYLEDAVALFNPEGELLFANPAMRAMLPADPLARPLDDLLPAGHAYREAVHQTLTTGQSQGPTAASVALAEGREVEQASHAAGERLLMTHAVKDVDNRLVGVMLVARNVEYLSRVQTTLNYSRKLVALGRLSAGVAHEVKNPLNAMMIHLELLKQKLAGARLAGVSSGAEQEVGMARSGVALRAEHGGGVPASVAAPRVAGPLDLGGALEHVNIITGEIRRLDEVVQGFLKFTRPEDLHLQPVDLRTLVDDVLRVVEPEAQSAQVTVRNEIPSGAPDINGDPAMLRQALLNLALNACQAMPHGGTLRLASAAASGRRVAVTVEDTGVGIKPEDLGRIFDLYFTTKARGSGIGLSMVYRIVQLHDGEVEVESTPGRGTTFRLVLPQA